MSVTDPEPDAPRQWDARSLNRRLDGQRREDQRWIICRCLTALTLLLLIGCVEEPLPERRISPGDCLLGFKLARLPDALKRCDQVVRAFPKDPAPLNDRFLLHSLAGDNTAACRDIRRADALARAIPADRLDPLLRQDLKQRLESCRD